MPRPRKYQPVEMCVCFNFNVLFKNLKKDIEKNFSTLTLEERIEKSKQILSNFSLNGQKFKFVHLAVHAGGYRWLVVCPKCGKNKYKLYLPKNYPDREQIYLCQNCHGLRTLSQMNGKSPKYRTIIRPLKRMRDIKEKLLNKKLSPEDAESLLEEYEKLEKSLKNSPGYRLWRFNVEHGNTKKAEI